MGFLFHETYDAGFNFSHWFSDSFQNDAFIPMYVETRSMSSQISGSNLRESLFADENVWADEIDDLLRNLDSEVLGDSWVVNDGVYSEGGLCPPTTSEKYSPSGRKRGGSSSVQFSYHSSYSNTKWFDYTSHFWVQYGSLTWDGRRNLETNQYGPREEGPSGFEDTIDLGQDVYTIDGYLVDSVTTSSVEKAVEHVKTQLEKVEERIKFNLDIEAAYGCVGSGVGCVDDITEAPHRCPVRVSGAGDKSVESQSKYFGFYTNILLHPPSDANTGTTSAYSHDASSEQIYENVNRAVSKYFELRDAGKTRSNLDPDHIVNYPKQKKSSLGSYGGNHINSGDDASVVIPIGCSLGDESVKKSELGLHGSAILYGRSDGCWEISNCVDEDESLIVAIGTEEYEVEMLEEDKEGSDGHYGRSCFLDDAIDVLSDIAEVRSGDNSEVDEVVTNKRLILGVRNFVSEPTDWRPSLLDAYCTDKEYRTDKDVWTAYLMSCIPQTFLGNNWDYKYKNFGGGQLILKYIPSNLTSWNQAVNKISISFKDGVYTVSDVFETDSEFHSVSKIINELVDRMSIIEDNVRANQFVEKIYTICDGSCCNVEYSEIVEANPTEILDDIRGVSTSIISSIAEEYGTYLSLVNTDNDLSKYKNHHFEKEADFISDYASQFTEVYLDTHIPYESKIPCSHKL